MVSSGLNATAQEVSDNTLLNGRNNRLGNLSLQQICQLKPEHIQYQHRKDILLAMRRILACSDQLFSVDDIERLVSLARYLCDWPALLRLQELGLWQASAIEIAQAEIQMGRFDRALARVDIALQSQACDMGLVIAKQELEQTVKNMPYPLAELTNGPVSLTPVHFHHVADFGWQYADSSIAELCSLPGFPSAQHWMHWLYCCQQEKERSLFAVIHQAYGFIGSVSLQVFNGLGFFYYWLGTDFQGMGLGPTAVEILMRIGRCYLGMESCYAKVFDYNIASNKAIAKLGFERLPFKALPPSEAEVFYYLGDPRDSGDHYQHLGWLLDAMRSGIILQ
ncbi:GNAT family protein [Chromatiaceae bacterium AAb-1]|nr:GNAT family protein [Chromatiaceae bacterium AAb-1]